MIKKYPQYQLFKFTLLLEDEKELFKKQDIDSRAVNGTIINRSYYSAFSYALLWLEEKIPKFKTKQKWEFEAKGEEFVSEHRQVRNALRDYDKFSASEKLWGLHNLLKKADYRLYDPLTEKDLEKSVKYMNEIIDELEF